MKLYPFNIKITLLLNCYPNTFLKLTKQYVQLGRTIINLILCILQFFISRILKIFEEINVFQ